VVTATLDWLSQTLPAPDVVKIDVEGLTSKVIQGGRSLLKTVRPCLLLEVFAGEAEVVGGLLSEMGYAMFDAESVTGHRRRLQAPAWNTLALPEERVAELAPRLP
jgi:hypothetical protein